MRQLITKILCIGLLSAGSILTASAQGTNAQKTPPTAATEHSKALRHAPFKGTVASVDKTAMTVTLEGEKHQLIHITSQTKIIKNGQPATFDDITAGAKVTGYKSETATDKWDAVSLKITLPKSEAPKK